MTRRLLKLILNNNIYNRTVIYLLLLFSLNSTQLYSQNGLFLPFIDDFSSYTGTPDSNLWQQGNCYVGSGYQFMPPTIGVVTLDILNANGEIYENANTYGFAADSLISLPIRMDSIYSPMTKKLAVSDSIYLSFFIQPGGSMGNLWERIGSAPSVKDSVVLQFYKSRQDMWNTVWSMKGITVDSIYNSSGTYFIHVMIPITDTAYFNSDFRFRFIAYSSLDSSPSYAHITNGGQWNIDYVYLNINRNVSDTTYRDISFVSPAQSLIKEFTAVPYKHFNKSYMKDSLDITITNLYHSKLNSTYSYYITDTQDNILHSYNGGFENINPYFVSHQFQTAQKHAKPELNFTFNPPSDKESKYIVTHIVTEGVGQDKLKSNDTIKYVQTFANYFAYDDGTSEAGIGIEPVKSSMLALGFPLLKTDTLYMVSIYFNQAYQAANMKPFKIHIFNATGDSISQPNELIYSSEKLTPQFWQLNKYVTYMLEQPVKLSAGNFFIAIESVNSVYLNIGFDQNNDARGHMFERRSNSWNEIFLKGAPMIRPYFGYTTVDELKVHTNDNIVKIYPNPASEYIHIERNIESLNTFISIFDRTGKLVKQTDKDDIYVGDLVCGMYIVRVEGRNYKLIIVN